MEIHPTIGQLLVYFRPGDAGWESRIELRWVENGGGFGTASGITHVWGMTRDAAEGVIERLKEGLVAWDEWANTEVAGVVPQRVHGLTEVTLAVPDLDLAAGPVLDLQPNR